MENFVNSCCILRHLNIHSVIAIVPSGLLVYLTVKVIANHEAKENELLNLRNTAL